MVSPEESTTPPPHHHGESNPESVTNVDGGANRPTLDDQQQLPQQQPIQSRVWMPSDAAMKTAESFVTILSIPINLARYRVRKAEQGKVPNSAEWLRWLTEDEQKALDKKRVDDLAQGKRKKKWWGVAGDE